MASSRHPNEVGLTFQLPEYHGGKEMRRVPTHRTPTHPGEMLLEEFLIPMGLTQQQLADSIHVPYQRVNELVNGKRGVTPGTALRLAKFFGNSPDFWLNLQMRWDLYFAQQAEADELQEIEPFLSA
jgi:addiction module HigA family antidote